AQYVWHVQNQAGACPKKHSSTLFICDDHRWWSSRQRLSSKKRKEKYGKNISGPDVCTFGKCSDNDPAARGRQARRTWELPHVPAHGAWAQKRAAAYCLDSDH